MSFSIIIIIITIIINIIIVIIIIIIIIIIFTSRPAFVELFIKTIYIICFIAVCATNPEYSGKYWKYVSVEYDSLGGCIILGM